MKEWLKQNWRTLLAIVVLVCARLVVWLAPTDTATQQMLERIWDVLAIGSVGGVRAFESTAGDK